MFDIAVSRANLAKPVKRPLLVLLYCPSWSYSMCPTSLSRGNKRQLKQSRLIHCSEPINPKPLRRRQNLSLIIPHQSASNSPPTRTLNTLQSILFLLILHLNLNTLGSLLPLHGDLLASSRLIDRSLLSILISSLSGSFGSLRCALGFLARSALVDAAGGDLGSLERVPAGAQGAAVFVAELEGDFFDVEL
jgi:hypothetical protein